MNRLLVSTAAYAAAGMLAGLYYRTLTHSRDFTGVTQLSVAHTHLLALGFIGGLAFLVLEAVFGFLGRKGGRVFEVAWHVGLVLTAGSMLVKGTLQVLGVAFPEAAIAGVSGLGHMSLTVALVALFVALFPAVRARQQRAEVLA